MLCSRCVRARTVPGRCRLGATQRPADRADTQGAVHAGARGAHQCHQPREAALHEPVRMSSLQEAAAYRPHLHFPPHAQDQQEPRLLDAQGCRPALWHQVNGEAGPLRSLLTRELTVQGTKTHDLRKFCCPSANIFRLLLKFVIIKWDIMIRILNFCFVPAVPLTQQNHSTLLQDSTELRCCCLQTYMAGMQTSVRIAVIERKWYCMWDDPAWHIIPHNNVCKMIHTAHCSTWKKIEEHFH